MEKIKKIFKGVVFVGFLLLMSNCSKDEIGQQNASQSSTQAKEWFDNHKNDYNSTVLKYIKGLNWEDAIINSGDIGEVIEVPFTLQNNLEATNKQANLYNGNHRLMFIKDKNNEFKLYYVQIFTPGILNKNINYYSVNDNFDGKILVQELSTNIGSKVEFSEGKKILHSLTARYDEEVCVYYGYWFEDGHFEALYEVACYGTGSTPNPGSGTPGPGYGYGGSAGGTTTPNPGAESEVEIPFNGTKIDPSDENKCFDKTKPATLTIYIQQPTENSRDKMGTNSVGHTFIGIKQGGIERIMGYYPDSRFAVLGGSQNSEIHDNSGELYHVKISTEIDATKLTNVINYVNSYPPKYNLNHYNCSDFGIAVAALGGLTLPRTTGTYSSIMVSFSGRNPGDLGQDVRNMTTPAGASKSTTTGNAPVKKGGC